MKSYLGIDVGTTSVKAVLLADDGELRASASTGYATTREGSAVEQDAQSWLSAVEHCVRKITEVDDLHDLFGVCIVSQVNTHVLTDGSFAALAPAVTWQDQRAAPAASRLSSELTENQKAALWDAPLAIDASFSVSRWIWLQEHNPVAAKRARWMLSPKDFCVAHLTGVAATDPFTPVGLVDPDGEYISGVLALADGFGELQPPVKPFDVVVGETVGTMGLPAGVPVACGTMDVLGTVVGSGVLEPGMGFQASGTSEVIGVAGEGPGGAPGVVTFPPVGECTVHAGPTQAGGQALGWAASLFGTTISDALAAAESRTLSSSTPLFLPHLDGERAPVWNPQARGVWMGLTNGTTKGDLILSTLEGVAFASRQVREVCEIAAGAIPDRLRASGGGSRSDLWNLLKASAHQKPLDVLQTPDSGAVGAALIAAASTDPHQTVSALARDLVVIGRTIDPDERLMPLLDRRYDHYRETYSSLIGVFAAFSDGGGYRRI